MPMWRRTAVFIAPRVWPASRPDRHRRQRQARPHPQAHSVPEGGSYEAFRWRCAPATRTGQCSVSAQCTGGGGVCGMCAPRRAGKGRPAPSVGKFILSPRDALNSSRVLFRSY
eukprot:4300237-Prymnesium_polylepis.2